jgi:hypothetical protein
MQGRDELTSVPSGLEAIVDFLFVFVLLDTYDNEVGQIAVHFHLLLLELRVSCSFCRAREDDATCASFHRTARYRLVI